jgi:hypothetical protein
VTSLVSRLIGSHDPRLQAIVDRVGRLRDRLDHPQLRDVRRLRSGTPEVLYVGESVLTFVGPHDEDQRNLPTMLADDLDLGSRLLALHGGGYHADLLATYLEIAATLPHRPRVVVVPLWVRGRFLPWIEHPRFGHVDVLRRLSAFDPAAPGPRGSLRRASTADFEDYYRRPHPTVLGDLTVGEYAQPLKARSLPRDEALRLLYAFHHGARLTQGSPAMDAVIRLGAAAKAMGCPVVAYETPLSVETGERVLGPEFRAVVEHNFAVMGAAYRTGAGADVEVLATGTAFSEQEFIDPTDGSEHLNESGRVRLAGLLAQGVRSQYGS